VGDDAASGDQIGGDRRGHLGDGHDMVWGIFPLVVGKQDSHSASPMISTV